MFTINLYYLFHCPPEKLLLLILLLFFWHLLRLLEVALESVAEAPAGLEQLPPGQVELCPLLLRQHGS